MSETKMYRLLELPWKTPERRFALVRPSARRPGDYEVGEGFPSPEEAELRLTAMGFDVDFRNDVEIETGDGTSNEYVRGRRRVRAVWSRRRRRRA